MKRFLSTLLALALIISLVPAAFAEDTTTETGMEYSGITVKYGMVKSDGYDLSVEPFRNDVKQVDFDVTNGFWSYYLSSNESNAITIPNDYALKIEASEGEWTALEIYVPKKGKYDITLGYSSRKTGNKAADNAAMWILPLINPETGAKYSKNEIATALKTDPQAPKIVYNSGTGSTVSKELFMSASSVDFMETGKYLIVYKALDGYSTTTTANMYPGTIILDGVEGESENIIPMTLPISADKTEIVVGSADNATAQMSATAYMSDGSAVKEEYTVSYTSSDDSIATVDNDGIVTAKAFGTATITATAVIDGYAVSGTKNITVNAEGVSIDYNVGYFSTSIGGTPRNEAARQTKYDKTNGFYQYYDGNFDINNTEDRFVRPRGDNSKGTGNVRLASNVAAVYEVYIPMAGRYTMEMHNGIKSGASDMRVYFSTAKKLAENGGVYTDNNSGNKDKIEASLGTYIGSYPCDENGAGSDFDKLISVPNKISGFEVSEAGYYTIAFWAKDGEASLGNFTLTNGTGVTLPMPAIVKVDKTTLTLNDTDNTATITGAVQCNTEGTVTAESGDTTVYESSDASVVTVDGKTITAVGTGTADITATIGDGITAKRTVTVVDKTATDEVETVQFMATSTLEDNEGVTTNISSYTVGETTDAIAPGKTVRVTANPVDGYIFRGWKRGSADNGVWVTTNETYSFPLLTNTYLTAIYDVDTAEDAAVNVEFYNFNGQFLASKQVNGEGFAVLAEGVTPTLTGYNSFFWSTDGENAIAADKVFDKLTRVVAKFTDTDSFAVTVPANVESNKTSGTYAYDTEIEMSADAAGFWKVNGKTVAYGTSYTYCVWSAATIEFEAKANDNKPIISIDGNATDGARMISYDANGADIVEAGILFGANATINSADSRAVSREAKGNVSGQFTAKPYNGNEANARGYLIYNDNGTYRVIYAD